MSLFKSLILSIIFFTTFLHPQSSNRHQKIADQLYQVTQQGNDKIGYSNFILEHLMYNELIHPKKYQENSRYRSKFRRRERLNMYSIFSGSLAIRESLQLETIEKILPQNNIIPITNLHAPVIKSHPFAKMLKGRKPKFYNLANYAPYDFYYAHFNKIKNALNFFDYLNKTGGEFYSKYSSNAIDYGVKEKVLTQLALKNNIATRIFYDKVINEMAVVGSDPFIKNGADVSLVFKLKNSYLLKNLFYKTINKYRASFKIKYKAKKKVTWFLGCRVFQLKSKDRQVNSYISKINSNTVVISNSYKALKIIIETYQYKRKSMSKSKDFLYMRTIYKADEKKEDAFIFMSDAFIRRLVGPKLRIKEARRMNEAARMTVLENYGLFYYQLFNKFPKTIQDLYKIRSNNRFLFRKHKAILKFKQTANGKIFFSFLEEYKKNSTPYSYSLRSAIQQHLSKLNFPKKKVWDKSHKITNEVQEIYKKVTKKQSYRMKQILSLFIDTTNLDFNTIFKGLSFQANSFKAVSLKYGSLFNMHPNIDLELKKVSQQESDRYNTFLKNYNNYWKKYFDPIGIRINLNKLMKIEICILPLINNSIYNGLFQMLSGNNLSFKKSQYLEGETFSLKLKTSPNNTGLPRNIKETLFNKQWKNAFTGEVQFHLMDSLPLVDFKSETILSEVLTSRNMKLSNIGFALLGWSLFHPIRVSLAGTSQEKLKKVFNFISSQTNLNKDGKMASYFRYSSGGYSTQYKNTKISIVKFNFFDILIFRLYFAVKDKAFHITTTYDYMKKVIDANYKFDQKDLLSGPAEINLRMKEMKKEKYLLETNILESKKEKCLSYFSTLELLRKIFPNENSNTVYKKYFNITPFCSKEGSFLDKNNKLYHTV